MVCRRARWPAVALLPLLGATALLCAVLLHRGWVLSDARRPTLLTYPEKPPRGSTLLRADTASPALDARFRDLDRQDNGEVDIDVSNAPMQAQVSNMDVSVSVGRPHAARTRRGPVGRPAHHEVVSGGVDAEWARRARTSALTEEPERAADVGKFWQAAAKLQQLSSAYLEDQGINTGEEYNRMLDHRVAPGQINPASLGSAWLTAQQDVPDLQPNPRATAAPHAPRNKLTRLGVNTGMQQQTQWDDGMVRSAGMEEPYSFGSAPTREWDSPSRRAGGWGVFKQTTGGTDMLAQAAKDDMQQVLADTHELEGAAGVHVDTTVDMDDVGVPDHMKMAADPREAWKKVPPSNGNLNAAGA